MNTVVTRRSLSAMCVQCCLNVDATETLLCLQAACDNHSPRSTEVTTYGGIEMCILLLLLLLIFV